VQRYAIFATYAIILSHKFKKYLSGFWFVSRRYSEILVSAKNEGIRFMGCNAPPQATVRCLKGCIATGVSLGADLVVILRWSEYMFLSKFLSIK